MGQGYTRNDSANNIANGNVIDAADLDGEFDAIVDSFAAATGHTHDGTTAEGGVITVIGPVQDIITDATAIYPKTDAVYDLGKVAASFDVAYVESINLGGTGITATATEINYTDGVTSAIQTQLDNKQPLATVLTNTTASFLIADETKLDGIEALADVTDTTNVTAAGALMDSEVDADIKTLVLPASTTISTYGASLVDDATAAAARTTLGLGTAATTASTDYATAAQGTTADAALPKAGGAMTGAITTTSTFDGRDVATDGTKLDGIEALADVTDVTNVTAAGALMDSEVDADIKTLVLPASTTISTYGASLVDDTTATAARTTLGLGTAATTASTAYATAAQGTKADSALQAASTLDATKLSGILPALDGSSLTGINAFKPTTVTGGTPSLNLGSFNFFDNGTLTADTTVSFASVPTEARWSYSFNAGTLDTWDISTAVYLQLFSVAGQDTTPTGIFFKPDGLKMYITGQVGDKVYEYDLSTAWDVTSAVYLQAFSVSAQDLIPTWVFFKPDGLKMYVMGQDGDDINEYDLSTAWDVTSAVYLQLFSVAGQETSPYSLFFKPDGTKMYVIGYTGDDVNEYDLSTAWDVTSAVYLQAFSVAGQETVPTGIFFKPDGLKMYVLGSVGDDINEYDLSTAWDVTSAVYLQLFSVAGQDTSPVGIFFKPDGTKMYITGPVGDDINEYDLGSITVVTLPASVEKPPTETVAGGDRVTYEFVTVDSGTTVTLITEEVLS